MGNGAVFQLVPQRFGGDLGVATGLVGAAGGLGGFLLPTLLGTVREATGSYAIGLVLCALAFAAGTIALLELGVRWSQRWNATAVTRSGIYAYRGGWRAAGESA
jgi:NNP family nitrate/nitrite transporter-like MFS transporter